LSRALRHPSVITEQFSRKDGKRMEEQAAGRKDHEQAQHTLRKLDVEEERILEAYRTGLISAAQLGRQLEQLTTRRSATQRTIKDDLSDSKCAITERRRTVTEYCRYIRQRLRTIGHSEKQQIIRTLVRSIVFTGSSVKIRGEFAADLAQRGSADAAKPQSDETAADDTGEIADRSINHRGRNDSDEIGFELTAELPLSTV